ncbi:hypothetical protein ACFOYW_18535 [Gryllotalpicola reticulitermitis]|uniref:Transposase n=1 Tax=Gryllotalpicola reticulitermitis TaxID=1184153 RepID=A0ABV8QDF3_9MICO
MIPVEDGALIRRLIADRGERPGSITWFRQNVQRPRPERRSVDPADRLAWTPGNAARWDLSFGSKRIPLEDRSRALLPVLVIVAAHSRFLTAQMIPTRTIEDLLLGSWELIRRLGRAPRRLIWYNELGIGQRDVWQRVSPPSLGRLRRRSGS